ncbi:MAG: EF-P lysine aminoacylase GenX [Bdellovibrionaceae bacterium]|nr:EF-P lysine aminoacylase GenX [Pseudobdellovibrionaceae bacterium]
MTREDFLSTLWQAYPPMPSDSYMHGRLLSLERDGAAHLWRDDQVLETTLRQWAEGDNPPPLADVLVPGDLLAVTAAGEVTLLAPWNVTGLFKPLPKSELRLWSRFQLQVRLFFEREGFLEVPTPGLVVCPGTEPGLDVFSTELVVGSRREKRYLPTSPELHLKKALARGLDRIFEIKSCYRNGEITRQHQPEFTLLEWYRAWSGPQAIEDDVVRLIQDVCEKMNEFDVRAPKEVRRTGMPQLFEETFGARLTPHWGFEDYRRLCAEQGIAVPEKAGIDDLFFLLFTERIESAFDPDVLMIVGLWPPFQAALARLGRHGWAERFEVYWRGFELANAFHELNDPSVQRQRFEADRRKKVSLGKEILPLDEEFLRALDSGLPPSAGIALGLERLFMALFDVGEISRLKAFPYS